MEKHIGLFVCIITIVIASCTSKAEPEYYYMMSTPCPDSCVRIWIPAEYPNHSNCKQEKTSPAMAVAEVINIIHDVNEHKIHYHIRQDEINQGFVLNEYFKDSKSKSGETLYGKNEVIHYHGIWVGFSIAKELIQVVEAHQHGAR